MIWNRKSNRPIVSIDSRGTESEANQKGGSDQVDCNLRICLNAIGGGGLPAIIGGHLYIVLEREVNGVVMEWGYRGGPGGSGPNGSKPSKGCDCTGTKYGQLIGTHAPYNKEDFVDYLKPENENCKSITVKSNNCEKLHNCFVKTLKLMDDCCIDYKPIPLALGFGGCNSNCTIGWLLKNCLKSNSFVSFIPLPVGKITPGIYVPLPKCIRDQKDPEQNT